MKYELQDLIDIEQFQSLQDRLNSIYSSFSAIVDKDGNILTATAWQDVCIKFHRTNKDGEQECIKSDLCILDRLHAADPALSYHCPHGLVDNAVPIIIDGIHYGNFFTGQFFLEKPDLDYFKVQARKYGFDEKAYIEAVKKVPVWTQEQLNPYLLFIKELIAVISASGLKKLKEIENRKRIEARDKRHRSILKSAMDGFWLTDTEGRLLEVNDTYCSMSGYTEDELLLMHISELDMDETPDSVAKRMQAIMSQGTARFESRHRHRDGTVFDVEVSIQFRPEEGGQCVCFLRDITEFKQTASALQDSEKRYRTLFENMVQGVFYQRADGALFDFNNAALDMFGLTFDQLMGKTSFDPQWNVIAEDGTNLPGDKHPSMIALQTGKPVQDAIVGVYNVRLKQYKWLAINAIPQFRKGEENPYQVFVTLQDITGHKKMETLLKESKVFLDSMPDVAYIADDQGNLVWLNTAIERITGLLPEKIIGKPFLDLFIEADHGSLLEVYKRTLAGESLENTLTFKSGVTCHFTCSPKYNENGEIVGTFGVARDISDRLVAENALKQSEARLKRAQETARIGNWEYDISSGQVWGSEEAFRIYGIERTSENLPLDVVEACIIDVEKVNQALVDLITRNKAYDIEFQIRPGGQKELTLIRSMADLICDTDGNPVKVSGVIQDITDYRRMEDQRKDAEETYKTLLRNLDAGVVVHSPDTAIVIANPAACRLLGLSEDQMLGKEAMDPQWNFIGEDGRDMPREDYPVNRVISSGRPLHNMVIGVNRSRSDDETWLLVNGFPVFKCDGQLEQVVITFVDITELNQAKEAVMRVNGRMRLAAESGRFGIWNFDVRNNRLEWDDWMFRLYGMNREHFSGAYQAWQSSLHPDDVARNSKAVEQALSGEKEFDTEFRIVRPDGEIRHIKAYAKVLRDNKGEPTHMTGVNYDVTDRIKAEAALKESEERFKALHNASFGGITIHDKGIILECNKGLSLITGYDYNELIGMNGLNLISDDTRDRVIKNINSGYEKPYEAKGVRKNGECYPLRLEARNIPYKGKAVRVVEFRDITENKKADLDRERLERQLQQAQKMEAVGRLAGGVAHDFNNILGVILGRADMIMEELEPGQPFYTDMEEIIKAGNRSVDLIRQLLAFARKQTVAPKILDLNETVSGMIRMLQRLIGEDIDLTWMPGEIAGKVKIDPGQIDQILANLCVNARDAIAGVGKVTIETGTALFDETYCADHPGFREGEYVLLAVSDNGCGMDPETLNNVFEPFFTTKAQGKGTGLGLSTVYGIVKQNDGFVKVYSEPDYGTTFQIYLSKHMEETAHLLKQGSKMRVEHGQETILLVEDEPAILKLTQIMLERMGYVVIPAHTPGEAIQLAHEYAGQIHLLVTDVVMPEMNGRDLAETILSFYPDLKRLFMSGYTANVIAHHGVLDSGINFIQKPFSKEALSVKVREALDRD